MNVALATGTTPEPALLLRPRDAARTLAISERKLWELTNKGVIPCVRIGRSVRYDPADLRAWIHNTKGCGKTVTDRCHVA